MKEYLFPMLLSALVVPGAGQIYNKEKVKGVVLMVLFFLVVLGFVIALSVSLASILPTGMVITPEQAKGFARQILEQKSGFIDTFWYLILAIWGYGILDAYLGARDLLKRRATPPSAE